MDAAAEPRLEGLEVVEGVEGVDVLVTGSGRGLGRGIAQAMAAAGARVWLVSEVREELEWTASDIRAAGGQAHIFVADLGREDERKRLVRPCAPFGMTRTGFGSSSTTPASWNASLWLR